MASARFFGLAISFNVSSNPATAIHLLAGDGA